MTQRRAVEAYGALVRIGTKVSGETAFALFRLKKALQTSVDFQIEEEQKLIEKHGGKITAEGRVIIADDAEREAFLADRKELGDVECDVQPVTIRAEKVPEITLADIEALDGFVIFE